MVVVLKVIVEVVLIVVYRIIFVTSRKSVMSPEKIKWLSNKSRHWEAVVEHLHPGKGSQPRAGNLEVTHKVIS